MSFQTHIFFLQFFLFSLDLLSSTSSAESSRNGRSDSMILQSSESILGSQVKNKVSEEALEDRNDTTFKLFYLGDLSFSYKKPFQHEC